MRSFEELYAIAAARKGGETALEALLGSPRPARELAAIADDRWLAAMARQIFQAGFSRTVIAAKWDGFEAAFDGFDPECVALYGDADLDRLLKDARIIRNGQKIAAVVRNAAFVRDVQDQHGSAAKLFADWPGEDLVGLLELMKQRGSRLGGNTGPRVLRMMGRDSYVMTPDVVARLKAEGVISGPPASKRAMAAVQDAFNTWAGQSGRPLMQISQVLAYSVGV